MALLSNRELMKYIEGALHSSQSMVSRSGTVSAYHHLYFSFKNLFEMLEEHQKEEDERLENFKPFTCNYYDNQKESIDKHTHLGIGGVQQV